MKKTTIVLFAVMKDEKLCIESVFCTLYIHSMKHLSIARASAEYANKYYNTLRACVCTSSDYVSINKK